ncbi:MAG: hypothetical protein B6241_07815 [Spirochaetaceae bacterium 4572_59]|nr:MAG: hypothetical protein B6241_07815 [Spirochaetaceae bacterium 4572_59]
MKKILIITILFSLYLALSAQSAADIVDRADQIFLQNKLYQKSTMTIVRRGKKQAVQLLESYFQKEGARNKSLTLFLEPRRVKGTAYLSIGDDLWVRFASTGRIRKMSSSAKKNSAGGSDFSYSDMGEGNDGYAAKYMLSLEGEEKLDGLNCYRILMKPRPGSSDIYEKAVAFISKSDYSYRKIELYEDGAHIKTMTFDDYRPLGDGLYPYLMKMESHARNSYSLIETLEMEVDSSRVQDRFFSKSYLEAIR